MDIQTNSMSTEKVKPPKFAKKCPQCGEENALSRKRCKKEGCHYEFAARQKTKSKTNYTQHKTLLETQADILHNDHGFDIAVLYWKNQGNGKSLVYRYGTGGNAESFIGSTKLKTSEAGEEVLKLFIDYLAAALQKQDQLNAALMGQDGETVPSDIPPAQPQSAENLPSTQPAPSSPNKALVMSDSTVSNEGNVPNHEPSTSISTDENVTPSNPSEPSSSISTDENVTPSNPPEPSTSISTDENVTPSNPPENETDNGSSDITMSEVKQPLENTEVETTSDEKPEPMDTHEATVIVSCPVANVVNSDTAMAENMPSDEMLSVETAASATIILESGQMIQFTTDDSQPTEDAVPSSAEGTCDSEGLYATSEITKVNNGLVVHTITRSGDQEPSTSVCSIGKAPTASESTKLNAEQSAASTGPSLPGQPNSILNDNKEFIKSLQVNASPPKADNTGSKNATEESTKPSDDVNSLNESSWTCHFCRKVFPDNSKLSAHLPTHTKDKPFKCEQCNKSFAQPCSLAKHLSRHSDKPAQMFVCQDCGQGFQAYAKLRQHFRVHTGEKPYKCTECGKGFKVASHVVKHQRIHTGEKPFVCTECGKAFTESGTLKRHVRTHTGEKPFKCDQCDKAFSQAGSLSMHMHVHLKATKKEEPIAENV